MTRRAAALLCIVLAGCTSEGSLVVQIRTDLTPVREFALARVRVTDPGGATRDEIVAAVDHRGWGVGVRGAELLGLAPGRHRLVASLERGDGTVVVERPAQVEVSSGLRVVTLLLTRSCGGVVCPRDGDAEDAVACLAGRCVLESCAEEAEGCAAGCATDADCAALTAPACGRVECSPSGSCFAVPDHEGCGADRVCDPRVGACVSSTASCATWGPWGDPVPLPLGINTPDSEYGPSLSADGLTLYFARLQPDGSSRIMRARRGQPTGDFGAPEAVPALDGMDAGEPSIAANGRSLVFTVRPTDAAAMLWIAPIDDAGEVGAPSPLPFTPFGMDSATGADLSADELVLAFTAGAYTGVERLMIATRDDVSQPFGPPEHIRVADDAGVNVGWPSISGDGLEIVFEANTGDGYLDLFVMRRARRDAPFGSPAPIGELNVPGFLEGDADVSYDGSGIWFTSGRVGGPGGSNDLWTATRACLD